MIERKTRSDSSSQPQHMVDWVEKAYNAISSDIDMVKRSFDVCGITTTDKSMVRNGFFYEKCMANACQHLEDDVEDDAEDDSFIL